MTETVYVQPRVASRHKKTFIPPLLIVPLVIYNIVSFVAMGGRPENWQGGIFTIGMVSGNSWLVSLGDLLLVASLVCLFFEVIKSTRTGTSSILEHMLSMAVFVVFLLEFILVGAAASSVFFLIMVMALIDVVAGFSVSITSAGRDVTFDN